MSYPVTQESASLETRDRLRLDADIYRPVGEETFPVLLMRQPYGRKIASTVVYAHPRWYAAQGYIVVIQDVRGRGTSAGEFELFRREMDDGWDSVQWVAELPGSTGEVGMYGFSYQGMTQLYAAAARPPALKTICPAMVAWDLDADWAYENGAFCLQLNFAWAVQLAAETARRQGDSEAYQLFYQAARQLPVYEPTLEFTEYFRRYDPFYARWFSHPQGDRYWQDLSPKFLFDEVDLPMLHIGGWFDSHLRGTLNLYRAMAAKSRFPQQLIVGPWAHLFWGRRVGDRDFGQQAISSVDRQQVAWFDRILKGKSPAKTSPVQLFEMGSDRWRNFEQFPQFKKQVFYLNSEGLASICQENGQLTTIAPTDSQTEDILVSDPWRPVPSLGGHGANPAGPFERSLLDNRSDVLTYTSAVLTEDLVLVGEAITEIFVEADTPSFDLCAVLSQVDPDGKVYNFAQGYKRINSPGNPVRFNLQATCIKIARGLRLRLSLSATAFPAYSLNPGTETVEEDANLIDAQIITLRVSCQDRASSRILLPVNG